MKLLYLAHDLEDDAVLRRQRFLREGGASVSLIGFRRPRSAASRTQPEGLAIGRTRDGRMIARIASVASAALASGRWHPEVRSADAIIARNLEMLLIAVLVRRRVGHAIPIIYECLDIHRLMSAPGIAGATLRRLEGQLLRSCSLLIVSSPKFIEAHFARTQPRLPQWVLLENKLLAGDLGGTQAGRAEPRQLPPGPPPGPPWRIGWFGVIRCRRSLRLLADLARASDGAIEVEIRGRPARNAIPEFDSVVASTPGLNFGGPYDRATDLAALYGRVHFSWAIDYYEDGSNSAWLLPNRLYEGSMFGAVPLALSQVETGRWLARHGCGLLLEAPAETSLPALFATMDAASFRQAGQRVAALDRALLVETRQTAAAFVARLAQLRPAASTHPLVGRARAT